MYSGNDFQGDTFRYTTITNVPLRSSWYWVHVAYCYFVALGVLWVLRRQFQLLERLRRQAKKLVGNHSVFIQAGVPTDFSHEDLESKLVPFFPTKETVVIHSLLNFYSILAKRVRLQDEYERLCTLIEIQSRGRSELRYVGVLSSLSS